MPFRVSALWLCKSMARVFLPWAWFGAWFFSYGCMQLNDGSRRTDTSFNEHKRRLQKTNQFLEENMRRPQPKAKASKIKSGKRLRQKCLFRTSVSFEMFIISLTFPSRRVMIINFRLFCYEFAFHISTRASLTIIENELSKLFQRNCFDLRQPTFLRHWKMPISRNCPVLLSQKAIQIKRLYNNACSAISVLNRAFEALLGSNQLRMTTARNVMCNVVEN